MLGDIFPFSPLISLPIGTIHLPTSFCRSSSVRYMRFFPRPRLTFLGSGRLYSPSSHCAFLRHLFTPRSIQILFTPMVLSFYPFSLGSCCFGVLTQIPERPSSLIQQFTQIMFFSISLDAIPPFHTHRFHFRSDSRSLSLSVGNRSIFCKSIF